MMQAAAVMLLTIGLWATAVLPEHLSALLFLCLCMLFAIAPASVVFSGFASGTLWLVLGGLVLAEAVRATGLGVRLAHALFGRFTLSYCGLIAAAAVVALLLAFLMPATVSRVLLLLPIYAAIAQRAGLAPGSKGSTGMALTAIIVSFQCGVTVLPANAPNLVLAGAAGNALQQAHHLRRLSAAALPDTGLRQGSHHYRADLLAVPRAHHRAAGSSRANAHVARGATAGADTGRCAGVVGNRFSASHSAGWIALAAGIVTLMTRVGALPHSVFPERIKLGSFFYVGAVLGFGALMQDSGVGKVLGGSMLGALHIEPGTDFLNFVKLTMLATFTGLITTNPSQPALLAPLARANGPRPPGWRIEAALMTMVVGFSLMIMPYQAPPVMVGMHVAGVTPATNSAADCAAGGDLHFCADAAGLFVVARLAIFAKLPAT